MFCSLRPVSLILNLIFLHWWKSGGKQIATGMSRNRAGRWVGHLQCWPGEAPRGWGHLSTPGLLLWAAEGQGTCAAFTRLPQGHLMEQSW